ncbi:UPF0149 family protein [Alteromonas sp. AMM-1]|uniref:UPF0149 family protein n=1 Tax=Alteromonas sp. AMM-1 TaxID=3394233 RepID=UPI0039A4845E
MLSPQTLRKQLTILSELSEKQPGYYYIHGYFCGLACAPTLIKPSQWLPALLGDIHFESESQLTLNDALFQLYNQIMDEALNRCVTIPAQCKLSKKDIKVSLAEQQPLPQWCLGVLDSFEWIETDILTPDEFDIFADSEKRVLAFTSWQNIRSYCRWAGDEWERHALLERRMLGGSLEELIDVLRFGGLDDDNTDFDDDFVGENAMLMAFDEQVSESIDEILATDSPKVIDLIDTILEGFEAAMGPGFVEQNTGHFWLIHETRNYMLLRQKRAGLNFKNGNADKAIEELQTLLRLNPNDNQAVRFSLINMLICKGRWDQLQALLKQFDEPSLPVLGGKALLAYHRDPKGEAAAKAKRALLKANKYVVKYLTGQKQVKHFEGMYSPGSAEEAELYILEYGKEAWRSVDGSLFWLRAS